MKLTTQGNITVLECTPEEIHAMYEAVNQAYTTASNQEFRTELAQPLEALYERSNQLKSEGL